MLGLFGVFFVGCGSSCVIVISFIHTLARTQTGVCEYASGSRYEGLWLDGLRHGEGVFYAPPGGAPNDGDPVAGIWHRDELSLVSSAASVGGSYRPSTEETAPLTSVLN